MVWDFAFGKPCDHLVLEELDPVVLSPTLVEFRLTFEMAQIGPGFVLTKNGVDVSSTLEFIVVPGVLKNVQVTGLAHDPAEYPPHDYTLQYYCVADTCPKCLRRR